MANNNQAANVNNHGSILRQLTTAISAQNKEAIKLNNLCCNKILCQVSQEESKKDQTKKIHPSLIKMICRAAALNSTNKTKALPATCSHFINQENVGMAQYDLVHQFKELVFQDIAFASGTTQALFIGEFLYSNSSTPSNFTIFAFHEQEPSSDKCQQDYLICHLIHVEGQKKTLEEIRALLKQLAHVPSDFNSLGIQIQLVGAASSIFFGKGSICTSSLSLLLSTISQNKKSFRDQIALGKFFAAKFLFAVDKQVRRWLKSCALAQNSRTQVNDRILQFDNLINAVLNGTFHMMLPKAFKKVSGSAAVLSSESKQPAGGKNKGGGEDSKGHKKWKSEDGNGNIVKNTTQPDGFKLTSRESWKDNFAMVLPHNWPA